MPAHVRSAAVFGIDALAVEVEVDVLPGLPSFTVVGLTDKAIQEARERLTAALSNLGYTPPRRKTIVSLAPASLKKEGSLYDLPIALGFLCASGQVKLTPDRLQHAWYVGELGLDGTIRAVRGILPIALSAIKAGVRELYVPAANRAEALALADRLNIFAVDSLQQVLNHLEAPAEQPTVEPLLPQEFDSVVPPVELDIADIKGQEHAKRALTVAAAGGHNVLLIGPPGTGKTLLARALVGILPPLRREESFIVTSIYSVAGLLKDAAGLIKHRPFRSPHHGASSVALVGGGTHPKPGEVSLAHQGVLFLDELPEFSRSVLEQLRQPIEDGVVTVARAAHSISFPARSMVVAAMNPCPCGYVGSSRHSCQCTPGDIVRYQRRVSGPLLDRFDLHVLVADIPAEELLDGQPTGKTSVQIRQQVRAARQQQWDRQGKTNSELSAHEIRQYCVVDEASRQLLYQAQDRFRLSSRGVHRLLKAARTIADLAGMPDIRRDHVAEALQYREQLQAALPDFV